MSQTSITVDGVAINIEYTYYRGSRGMRDSLGGRAGCGAQIEPDEEPEVEIEEVRSSENIIDLLSQSVLDKLAEKIMEG